MADIDTSHNSNNLRRLKATNTSKSTKTVKSNEAQKSSKSSKGPKSSKSSKGPKSSKSSKGPKSSKEGKSSKASKSDKQSNLGCFLPVIKGGGAPHWVQTGQVMTQFEETLNPRKTFTSKSPKDSRTIKNNDQYMVQCAEKDYLADELCVVTCIDGALDTTKYCAKDPEDICVLARELTYTKECELDFDSDAPFHEGKSLKQWWKEVIDKYYFSGKEIFDRSSDIPFLLGHGAAFLEGYGVAVQHFGVMPAPVKFFNADAVEITGWVSDGYEYGADDLTNSQTLPNNSYLTGIEFETVDSGPFKLPIVTTPVNFPNPKLKTMSILRDTHDPCDESTYLGFAPSCFLYHPAGHHVGNGKMLNFLSPLSNGDIDMGGVCTGMETIPPITVPALMANYADHAEYIEKSGGLIATHPVSNTLHLCIDGDDIYHPRLCPWHTDDADIDSMKGDFLSVDARPFMPQPKAYRKKMCDIRTANPGICDGPFDNSSYPYPWTQYL